MLTYRCLRLEINDAIAVVRLDFSGAEGRENPTPAEELQAVCQTLNEDSTIRAIVFIGEGDTFWDDNPTPWPMDVPAHDMEALMHRRRVSPFVAGLKAPTIAAIRSRAWNQGLELALACDLRLAAEDSSLGFSYLDAGFIPWDGGTQRLPRIVGRAEALELLLTGRKLSASEALEMGLVNNLVPAANLETAALKLAGGIAEAAPVAVRYLKEAVYKGMDMSLMQGLNLEADLSFILQTTRDRQRGIQSFLDKTTPKFIGE